MCKINIWWRHSDTGYWKIYVLVHCRAHILLWKWRSKATNQPESSCFSRFHQISCSPDIWQLIMDLQPYLWHNHPFDLVWFHARTICIFIRTASDFIKKIGVLRDTARAPQPPANPSTGHRMSQQWSEMPNSGQIWWFLGKKSFFYWRNQKFCYSHNGKPT